MTKATEMVTDIRGWQALDLDNKAYADARAEQQSEIKAINADMRELFMDSELGQRVLSTLIDWTVRQPVAKPEYGPENAYFREGQNDIVRSILSACHNSEEGDPNA